MNVPVSKEHGFFTIWTIPATHDELCLSKIQNSIFEIGANPSDGRYYRKSIEIIDTYKSIDTFDTRKKYR